MAPESSSGNAPPPPSPASPRERQASGESNTSATSDVTVSMINDMLTAEERAERGLVQSIEGRRIHRRLSSGSSWASSVDGERPPLGNDNVALEHMYNAMDDVSSLSSKASSVQQQQPPSSNNAASERPRLADIARKVRRMNSVAKLAKSKGSSPSISSRHRKTKSKAHALLESIQEDDHEDAGIVSSDETSEVTKKSGGVFESVGGDAHPEKGDSTFSVEGTDTDRLFAGAVAIDELLGGDGGNDSNETASTVESLSPSSSDDNDETLPLRQHDSDDAYGSTASKKSAFETSFQMGRRKKLTKWKRFLRHTSDIFNPAALLQTFVHAARESYTFTVGVGCFAAAWVLFYYMGNPFIEFLPGRASLSWWLNFTGRLLVTLDLARLLQFFIIDKIILGTRFAVHCLGPLVTLCAIQAKGWPFTVAMWGLLNMFLLHGNRPFTQHWLSGVTSLQLYNEANSGSYILDSPYFDRILLSMMMAGLATAGKRTAVAMFFGRRTFTEFKPRLEKILREVILLSEVAELAVEADRMNQVNWQRKEQVQFFGDVHWRTTSPSFNKPEESSDDEDDSQLTAREESSNERFLGANQSGSLRVKDLLDHWDEPVNKMDKSMNASIQDILKFRRALSFMDDDFTFGEAFGPARNREEVITSSHNVYQELLKLTPGRHLLSWDVFGILAEDDDGIVVDHNKRKALRKLFRPDANNEISLLAFIQSCDSLYKRLRFFRASVGNASVIGHALEKIVDGIYHFILILMVLSVMRINAWSLLLSLSTLLVSLSFAVGSSASKYIEGLLLIAVRRPYDLGDRIFMMDPSAVNNNPGIYMSWFVEDINLFYTTIRYAGTNEISTINNGSIANMRIVNANRSPDAIVWFQLPFHMSITKHNKLPLLRAALDKYAKDRPHQWHSFSYCRVTQAHVEQEKIVATIGFQSRRSWQDLSSILTAKGDLICYILEWAREAGVAYDEMPRRELLYYAGALKSGKVDDYRRSLHHPENIVDQSEASFSVDKKAKEIAGGDRAEANAQFLSQLQQSHAL